MKNKKTILIIGLALLTTAVFGIVPFKPNVSSFIWGNGSSNVSSTYDVSGTDGIMLYDGTDFDLNRPLGVTGAITATGDISGLNGTFIGNLLTLGDGTATDKDILINRGGSNPFIRWDESESAFVVSNDGVSDVKLGLGGLPDVNALVNLGLTASVATSALTVDLKQADGSTDPTSAAPVNISFRDSTITNGGFNSRSVTGALTIVVPSGATLGTIDAVESRIYIYAIDNAGTVELAVGNFKIDATENVVSTTVLNASSDASNVLYSTVARSNVPIRILGIIEFTQATAGTYATSHSLLSVGDHVEKVTRQCRVNNSGTPAIDTSSGLCEIWVSGFTDNGVGDIVVNIIASSFSKEPVCAVSVLPANFAARDAQCDPNASAYSISGIAVVCMSTSGATAQDRDFLIKCTGAR